MHLLIPFAASRDAGCAATLRSLRLPRLATLLRALRLQHTDRGDRASLSPPHERALARLAGLPVEDGRIPWAAQAARARHPDAQARAWAWVSPAHWSAGLQDVRMADPQLLQLEDADAQALCAAMAPYFAEDGIVLLPEEPLRWLAHGAVFEGLASASPDRACGGDLRPWMPAAAVLRRLQNEMQMLLYTHPVNDRRAAQGLPPVNSFWVHGTGDLPPGTAPQPAPAPRCIDSLRPPALAGDWPSWADAWAQVDAQAVQDLLAAHARGEPVALTLCGEADAITFGGAQPTGWWQRMRRRWQPPVDPAAVLEAL